MTIRFGLVAAITLLACHSAQALDSQQLTQLRQAVLEMCRGGSLVGSSSKINVEASGDVRFVIVKGLLQGGADAKVEILKEEWDGIKALINPEGYTECVNSTLTLLLPHL